VTFNAEIETYLKEHPDTEVVELLIVDINGIFRGKQMPVSALKKVAEQGICFPITTPFLTTNGANAERTLDEYGSDPDRICFPVAGTLKPMPWAKKPSAQLLVQMHNTEDDPIFSDPRTVLQKVLKCYGDDGLTPVVALEYEFFLFEAGSVPPKPVSPPNGMPRSKDANCYNMDVFYDFEELLQEIESACIAQGVQVSGLVCEYGNGQFEVNLEHSDDALKMCDDAMLLKRAVRSVALKHGLLASFMAKPADDEVGSGMHAHVSLQNAEGQNIFSLDKDITLKYAVGGLLSTMREATAFFAPNANSFRRFDPEWYAPVVPNWGENNRRLSVRLPLSDSTNRRFEHRVSGADASPHLMMAAILAGAHYGLKNMCDPGQELGEFDLVDFENVLPSRWKIALDELAAGSVLKDYFGDKFIKLYLDVRGSEEEEFHRAVTSADHEQYLRVL